MDREVSCGEIMWWKKVMVGKKGGGGVGVGGGSM